VVQSRAIVFFLWLGGFVALVALIGFLPAIVVFVVANMTLAYGKGLRASAASAVIVGVFCWLVFHVLLQVAWPDSVLGDLVPNLRTATGFL
jgi:putative tricarboxylic transport membrane protein